MRAIEALQRQMRLDPFYVPPVPGNLGFAHYMLRQYAQALPLSREWVSRTPNFRAPHVFLAATYAQLGNFAARRAAPHISPPHWLDRSDSLRQSPSSPACVMPTQAGIQTGIAVAGAKYSGFPLSRE